MKFEFSGNGIFSISFANCDSEGGVLLYLNELIIAKQKLQNEFETIIYPYSPNDILRFEASENATLRINFFSICVGKFFFCLVFWTVSCKFQKLAYLYQFRINFPLPTKAALVDI